ncbi:MAG TPA: CRTAC1 family protein [Myxococcota bacterium]|nr:CRTAC1 family protein [Myxococcota bacterium]
MLLLLVACRAPEEKESAPAESEPEDSPTLSLPLQCAYPTPELVYSAVPGLLDTTDSLQPMMEQGAVAMADLDGDGDDDLLISKRNDGLYLQKNASGVLGSPLKILPEPLISTLALGDVDADHDLDLLVGGHGDTPTLMLNDAHGGFVAVNAGLPTVVATIRGANFGDTDGDGDLDLVLAVAGEGPDMREHLLLNDGSGFFTDGVLPAAADGEGLSWDPLLADLDRDGDLDLYLVNAEQDRNGKSRYLVNQNGVFSDAGDRCTCTATGNPMGAGTADFNGDLLPDLFVASTGSNYLLTGQQGGGFVDVTASTNAAGFDSPEQMAYGAMIYDHDNDRDLDILIATGPLGEARFTQPDLFLDRQGEVFVERAAAMGLADMGVGRAAVAGLLDGDAFLDPLVSHLGSPSTLWVAPCTDQRALVVELLGKAPNRYGVGAWVEVDSGDQTFLALVSSHAGWGSAVHPRAHFGLGSGYAERLRVFWPSGAVQEVELGPETEARILVEEE